jgi:hypothetical protein
MANMYLMITSATEAAPARSNITVLLSLQQDPECIRPDLNQIIMQARVKTGNSVCIKVFNVSNSIRIFAES